MVTKEKQDVTKRDVISNPIWKSAKSKKITGSSTNGFSKKSAGMNGLDKMAPLTPALLPEEADPFYYGWRTEMVELPDGTTQLQDIPLPPERFLDPQIGDFFMQSDKHYVLASSVHNIYDNRYDNDDSVGVFSDLKMLWGIPGIQEPAPDVAIVPNLKNPHKHRKSFDVTEEGTRPILVVEVTSPNYPFDKNKVPIYEQVEIQEYIIIDPHWGKDDEDLEFFGYHLVSGQYQPMIKDDEERLYSATTDTYLFFEIGEGDEVNTYITDGITGERLLDNRGSHRARLVAEERAETEAAERQAAEERAETEAAERRRAC